MGWHFLHFNLSTTFLDEVLGQIIHHHVPICVYKNAHISVSFNATSKLLRLLKKKVKDCSFKSCYNFFWLRLINCVLKLFPFFFSGTPYIFPEFTLNIINHYTEKKILTNRKGIAVLVKIGLPNYLAVVKR